MAYDEIELREEILSFFEEGQARVKHGAVDWYERDGMSTEKERGLPRNCIKTQSSNGRQICPHCFSTAPDHRCPDLVSEPIVFHVGKSSTRPARGPFRIVSHYMRYAACQLCGATAKGHNCPVVNKKEAAA